MSRASPDTLYSRPLRLMPATLVIALTLAMALPESTAQIGGGRVITVKKRKDTLDLGRQDIDQKNPAYRAELASLSYPFAFKEEIKPVEAPTQTRKEEVVVVQTFSDREILEEVSAQIRPTGTLMRGNQRILVFPQGQIVEGGTVRVNFRGTPHIVRIMGISDRGYTLVMNDETMERTFGQASEGAIRRDPAQP